jgi:dienelactone hydrolase
MPFQATLCRFQTALATIVILFSAISTAWEASGETAALLWDLETLGTAPATEPADSFGATDVNAIFFQGEPSGGKPSKVFAYYALPEGASSKAPVPGVVCVHGGSGTAFAEWVKIWNKHGFAAIALDTNGAVPQSINENPDNFRHSWAGPRRYGFDQVKSPERDQWPYHAVAAIIRANSLLRSLPEVDASNVGITGISWGGYLTSLTAGIDLRFEFAIPVYGCGFLDDGSSWEAEIKSYGHDRWMKLWDPSSYLSNARMPILWVNGTNDAHYHLGPYQRTYRLPQGPRQLAIRVRMDHGHGSGWEPPEIYAFAKAAVGEGRPLVRIARQGQTANRAWVEYETPEDTAVKVAELNYTTDSGAWVSRRWETVPAQKETGRKRASAEVPEGTAVYYFNLVDSRGLLVSSEHVELGDKANSLPTSADVPSH